VALLERIKNGIGFGRGASRVDTTLRSGFNVSEFQSGMFDRETPWSRGRIFYDREGLPVFPDEPTLFSPEDAMGIKLIADDMEERMAATVSVYKDLPRINKAVTTAESAHAKALATEVTQNADMLDNVVDAHRDINQQAPRMVAAAQRMGRSEIDTNRSLAMLSRYDAKMRVRTWGVA